MKIYDLPPLYTRPTSLKKSGKKTFDPEVSEANETSATAPITSVTALTGLQEIQDLLVSDEAWLEHGTKLLKGLQQLQLSWLTEGDVEENLTQLDAELQLAKGKINNKSLEEAVDFIHQRVAIELEKFKKRY